MALWQGPSSGGDELTIESNIQVRLTFNREWPLHSSTAPSPPPAPPSYKVSKKKVHSSPLLHSIHCCSCTSLQNSDPESLLVGDCACVLCCRCQSQNSSCLSCGTSGVRFMKLACLEPPEGSDISWEEMTFSSFMERSAKEKRKEQFFFKLFNRQRQSVERLCSQAEDELNRKQKECDSMLKEIRLKEESISELKKSVAALKNSGNRVSFGCSQALQDICVSNENKISSKENIRLSSSKKSNTEKGQDFELFQRPKGILKKSQTERKNLGF